ncbi:MAG TPA: formylmethanofuran dehydrogenase subunit A, partial [Candidatus Lokiarchaeia archaeon]|nr:formylmethanofuran dehydrogenase subunit A [Candidatus Lokiarchaeia archaeon]
MGSLLVKGGHIYDPLNNINGDVMDIAIKDGIVVAPEELDSDVETIDASGMVVFPGGVDIHTHFAGPKVNLGREFRPEDHRKDPVTKTANTRSGAGFSVPTTYETGYRYAKLGYTTLCEPAMPPLLARHTHEEFADTPIVDKMAFPLFGNKWFALEYIRQGRLDLLKAYVAWLLKTTKGYAVKIVNPGGVENWAWGKNCDSLDSKVEHFDVSPRELLVSLATVNEELGLPHTIHIHGNNLGHPGNAAFTCDTFEAMRDITPKAGRDSVVHFTHVQFNSYEGKDWNTFASGASQVADYLNANKHVTCDVGQIVFADTTTMTADGPWEFALHHIGAIADWGVKPGMKWINGQVETECGSGVVPYIFKPKNPVNAVQWAIGLEILLQVTNPWQICITTDNPNAGPFIYYPKIVRWLMFAGDRADWLKNKVHSKVAQNTALPSLDREYSLFEIATVTRAGAAKMLGLADIKGHLGIGAHGDVAIYGMSPDERDPDVVEKAFSNAAYTIKGGDVVVRDNVVVASPIGRTLWTDATGLIKPDLMAELEQDIKEKWS